MNEEYNIIDLTSWKRSVHCEAFRNATLPHYCVTVELDITNFKKKVKEQGRSFSFALMHAVSKCANEVEEFRYRFIKGNVGLYDKIHTAFTFMDEKTELFKGGKC